MVEVDFWIPVLHAAVSPRTYEYAASDLKIEPFNCSPEGLTGTLLRRPARRRLSASSAIIRASPRYFLGHSRRVDAAESFDSCAALAFAIGFLLAAGAGPVLMAQQPASHGVVTPNDPIWGDAQEPQEPQGAAAAAGGGARRPDAARGGRSAEGGSPVLHAGH